MEAYDGGKKQQILYHAQIILIHDMIWMNSPAHIPTSVRKRCLLQEEIPSNSQISRHQTGQVRVNKFLWEGTPHTV